jgi:hypothetical protein
MDKVVSDKLWRSRCFSHIVKAVEGICSSVLTTFNIQLVNTQMCRVNLYSTTVVTFWIFTSVSIVDQKKQQLICMTSVQLCLFKLYI